jgi:hypothetical protein
VSDCRWCGIELVKPTRGPMPVFCSDAHRKAAKRELTKVVRSGRCFECNRELEGRQRIRCSDVFCEQVRSQRYREHALNRQAKTFFEHLDQSADAEDTWGWTLVNVTPQGEKPPKRCNHAAQSWGDVDIDPLAHAEGWDAQAFVDEFGRSGWVVGQTYVNPGRTLG